MYVSGHAIYEHMPVLNAAIFRAAEMIIFGRMWTISYCCSKHRLVVHVRIGQPQSEPRSEKLVFGVPDQVLYKPGWIITEDG